MEKSKMYNINYLKEIFFQEVVKLDNKIKEYNNLEFYITNLEMTIKELENEDYVALKDNFIYLDSFLPSFYNLDYQDAKYKKLSDKIFGAICICANYEAKPEKYNKEQYISSKEYIRSVKRYLENLLISKNVEMRSINKTKTIEKLIQYKRILTNLKYDKKIDNEQYKIINELLNEKDYDTEAIIILLEVVRKHNVKINLNEKKQKINYSKLNEITDMFKLGFEIINVPYIGNNTKELDAYINTVISVLKDDKETAYDILPLYEGDLKFTSNYAKQEYSYIFNSILLYLQNNIIELIDLMKDIDNYSDKAFRKLILEDYKHNLDMYVYIRKVYLDNLDKYEEDLNKKQEEEDKINVSYAATSSNQVSYLESDLKDIPKDRYKDLINLLIKFKKDALAPSELKYLNEAFPGMGELRDDQLRILFKRDENNNFVIIGAFIKKDDNDRKNYVKFYNRGISVILPKEEAEKSLFDKIANSKHSGGRKNA